MTRFPIPILLAAALAAATPLAAQEPAPATPPSPAAPAVPEAPPASDRRVEAIVAPSPAPAPDAPRKVTFGFVLDPTVPPRVVRVLPGTPVDAAGVRDGDVLLEFDGEPASVARIVAVARATTPGDTVEVVIRRDDRDRTIRIVTDEEIHWVVLDPDSIAERARHFMERAREGVATWSADSFRFEIDSLVRFDLDTLRLRGPDVAWATPDSVGGRRFFVMPRVEGGAALAYALGRGSRLGLRITDLNEGLAGYFPGAEEGVLVLAVDPDSPAEEAGVEAGDVVVEVNGRPVWNTQSFQAARGPGDTALTVVRKGQRREIRVAGPD